MVSRGPRYPWVDFDGLDAEIEEMELILTTIFPDRVIRQFFLDVASSFLRRRNRFKHFYVFTPALVLIRLFSPAWSKEDGKEQWLPLGNTNGGKSLLFSLLRHAFGSLAGQMPGERLVRRTVTNCARHRSRHLLDE